MRKLDDSRNNSNNANVLNSSDSKQNLENRYCTHCSLKLVPRINEPRIYSCPACNVTSNLTNTYPEVKIRLTFPSSDPTVPTDRQHAKVVQNEDEKLSRSELYQKRRQEERFSKTEANDLMLKHLKANQALTITDVFYSESSDEY